MENRIKETRMGKLMSQEELSEKSGVSRTVISKLENNPSTNVSMVTIVKLSEALEVPPLSLFVS